MKIVSLVPSITELLSDLGLNDQVVGITKFCVHPENWYRNKRRVGGTKTLHLDIIRELQPDWIIANKEENTKEQIEALAETFDVYVSNVSCLEDNIQLIYDIAAKTDAMKAGQPIIEGLNQMLIERATPTKCSVAYLIWENPKMTVGNDTFIHDILSWCGFSNVFGALRRYPQINADDLKILKPDHILLSSEPFPFKDKHIDAYQKLLPDAGIHLVDGEAFSWYGSRLLKKKDYLIRLRENLSA